MVAGDSMCCHADSPFRKDKTNLKEDRCSVISKWLLLFGQAIFLFGYAYIAFFLFGQALNGIFLFSNVYMAFFCSVRS
jgi:hypothetical protein